MYHFKAFDMIDLQYKITKLFMLFGLNSLELGCSKHFVALGDYKQATRSQFFGILKDFLFI